MNTIDLVLGIFLLIIAFFGFKKGFIASIIQLAALIIALLIVAQISPHIAFFLITKFQFSELAAAIVSYLLVFIAIGFLAKLTIVILHKIVKLFKIGFINHILGFLFGLLNGTLVLTFFLLLINISPFRQEFHNWSQGSKIVPMIQYILDEFTKNLPVLEEQPKDGIDELFENMKDKV